MQDLWSYEDPAQLEVFQNFYDRYTELSKQSGLTAPVREQTQHYMKFGQGLLSSLSLGTSNALNRSLGVDYKPDSISEHVAYHSGELLGFIAMPINIAGRLIGPLGSKAGQATAKWGLKMLGKNAGATAAKRADRLGKLTEYVFNATQTLGVASAISDINAPPKQMAQSYASGATLGAVFGGTAFMHSLKHPVLSWIGRQFAGRTLMGMTKLRPYFDKDFWSELVKDKDAFGQVIYDEMINTYFLSHGITPAAVGLGDPRALKAEQLRKLLQTDKALAEMSVEIAKDPDIKLSNVDFAKFKRIPYNPEFTAVLEKKNKPFIRNNQIEVDPKRVDRERLPDMKDRIERGYIESEQLRVVYDPEKMVFKPEADNHTLWAALKDYTSVRKGIGERTKQFEAVVVNPETLAKSRLLPRAIDYAIRYKVYQERVQGLKEGKPDPSDVYHGQKLQRLSDSQLERREHKSPHELLRSKELDLRPDDVRLGTEAIRNLTRGFRRWDLDVDTGTLTPVEYGEQPVPHFSVRYEKSQGEWLPKGVGDGVDNLHFSGTAQIKKAHLPKVIDAFRDSVTNTLIRNEMAKKEPDSGLKVEDIWGKEGAGRAYLEIDKTFGKDSPFEKRIKEAKPSRGQTYGKYNDLMEGTKYVNKKIAQYEAIPTMDVPARYMRKLTARINALKLDIAPDEFMAAILEKGEGAAGRFVDPSSAKAKLRKVEMASAADKPPGARLKIKIGHLPELERHLKLAESASLAEKIDYILAPFNEKHGLQNKYAEESAIKKGPEDVRKRYNRLVDAENKRRSSKLTQSWRDARTKANTTVLSKLLAVSRPQSFLDARYLFQAMESNTGLPMWKIAKRVMSASRQRKWAKAELTRELNKIDLSEKDLSLVEQYYKTMYSNADLPKSMRDSSGRLLLPESVKEYIQAVDNVMGELKPMVQLYRWRQYYENIVLGKNPKMRVYRMQAREKDPNLQKEYAEFRDKIQDLTVAWTVDYQVRTDPKTGESMPGYKHHPEQFIEVLESIAPELGAIQSGYYLPLRVLSGDKQGLVKHDILVHADTMGTTHIRSRGEFTNKRGKEGMDLGETVYQTMVGRDLRLRLDSYINQVMNLHYMQKPLETMEGLVNIFQQHFDKATSKQLFKESSDPTSHSTLDWIRLWAHRQKGFPVRLGPLGRGLKTVQSFFYRTLTLKPFLWMRNLFQNVVMSPDKGIILDYYARKAVGKAGKFKDLPPEAKDFYWKHVAQMESLEKHQLWLEATDKLLELPIAGEVFRLAEKVGHTYALTDNVNRTGAFMAYYERGWKQLKKYRSGETNIDTMFRKTGAARMEPIEQKEILQLVAEGKDMEVAKEIGKWGSDNTNWLYRRSERSLVAMSQDEALTNLMTWTKGVIQRSVKEGRNLYQGVKEAGSIRDLLDPRRPPGEKATGAIKYFVGVRIASLIAESALTTIANGHFSKYKSYGPGMFFWELGGVPVDMVNEFVEAASDLSRGEAGSMARFADSFLGLMVPFYDSTTNVLEAITDKDDIRPFQRSLNNMKKGFDTQEYVDRTIAEAVLHGLFGKDPKYSVDKEKYLAEKLVEAKKAAITAKDPLTETFFKLQVDRYEGLLDVLHRYKPELRDTEEVRRKMIEKRKEQQESLEYKNWYEQWKKRHRY
jgi:hypothetical protein